MAHSLPGKVAKLTSTSWTGRTKDLGYEPVEQERLSLKMAKFYE